MRFLKCTCTCMRTHMCKWVFADQFVWANVFCLHTLCHTHTPHSVVLLPGIPVGATLSDCYLPEVRYTNIDSVLHSSILGMWCMFYSTSCLSIGELFHEGPNDMRRKDGGGYLWWGSGTIANPVWIISQCVAEIQQNRTEEIVLCYCGFAGTSALQERVEHEQVSSVVSGWWFLSSVLRDPQASNVFEVCMKTAASAAEFDVLQTIFKCRACRSVEKEMCKCMSPCWWWWWLTLFAIRTV